MTSSQKGKNWTIPDAEIINGKIEIFSKHQRFLIESSKYLKKYFYYYHWIVLN
jgi:hypothetical protein